MKIILWKDISTARGAVLKGCRVRKVENHYLQCEFCSRSQLMSYLLMLQLLGELVPNVCVLLVLLSLGDVMKCIHPFIQSLLIPDRFLFGVSVRGKLSFGVSVLWNGTNRMNMYCRSQVAQSVSRQYL